MLYYARSTMLKLDIKHDQLERLFACNMFYGFQKKNGGSPSYIYHAPFFFNQSCRRKCPPRYFSLLYYQILLKGIMLTTVVSVIKLKHCKKTLHDNVKSSRGYFLHLKSTCHKLSLTQQVNGQSGRLDFLLS